MAKEEVTMPRMGESITEGTVLTWHKKPGEKVELDETLLEIGTDKVDTEIPSPADGVLEEILVQEGETVEVGTAIAIIETEPEAGSGGGAEDQNAEAPPQEAEVETEEESSEEAEERTKETSEAESAEVSAVEASEEVVAEGDGDVEAEAEDVEPHLDVRPTGEGDVEVVMPKMGESITEGTVLAWHKQVGDDVELDELLLEIGTDKVDTDVPSPAAGVLKEILVEVNETVEVGTPLAIIGVEAEAGQGTAAPVPDRAKEEQEVAVARPPEQEQQREPAQTSGVSGDGSVLEPAPKGAGDIKRKGEDGRFYSPLVRSIAEKEGLSMDDLESIPGSGRDGRVTKSDVLNYVQAQKARASDRPSKATKQAAAPQAAAPQAAAPPQATEAIDDGEGRESRVEVMKMDRMRQIIAEHMVRSKATSAHVTSFTEADVTNLIRLRERNKESFQEREGVKLTFTPFFVRAAIDALREHPILNSSVEEDQIVIRKDLHVGIAVAIGKTGLVAPVIRSAGQKSLAGLAHAAADLAERARNKKLQPDELQGGTFTLTNIGSLGSLMGTPIINQPQVAILAIGAIKKRPVVIEDPDLGDIIAVRHMMYLSLSYDHRIIDGAMAASFLQRFVRTLEEIDPDEEL